MPTEDVITQLERDSADHARPFRWTTDDVRWLHAMGISDALLYGNANVDR